jgi:hypothetical protein
LVVLTSENLKPPAEVSKPNPPHFGQPNFTFFGDSFLFIQIIYLYLVKILNYLFLNADITSGDILRKGFIDVCFVGCDVLTGDINDGCAVCLFTRLGSGLTYFGTAVADPARLIVLTSSSSLIITSVGVAI